MTTVIIEEISVKFPFTPYKIQKNYMEQVIKCLKEKQNGVLESPTGTGKTLSLLCASLAWLDAQKAIYADTHNYKLESEDGDFLEKMERKYPKIIYASRTHTQLHQAIQEMKRTEYRQMKACVIGSRAQLCIDPEVISEKENLVKLNLCKAKVSKGKCLYHLRVGRERKNVAVTQVDIIDMEDLIELGKCHNFCPYFMARELKSDADVIFMPYNYLLDFKTRKDDMEFKNCVVILDEAHNIEKVCEDAVSTQISSTDLTQGVEDVTALLHAILGGIVPHHEEVLFSPQQLRQLNEILTKLKHNLNDMQLLKYGKGGTYFDGDYMYQIFNKAGLPEASFDNTITLIDRISEFLANTSTPGLNRGSNCLDVISQLLTILSFNSSEKYHQKIKDCFKVHVNAEVMTKFGKGWLSQANRNQEQNRILSFWCFSPGFAMKMLIGQEIHCLILTSGTLAPLKPLISELEIQIGARIENPHIIKGDQVCVKILSKGPDLELLNGKFDNRDNPKYLRSLGMTIQNLVRVIPHGVLIFFPSYYIMEKSAEFWAESGTWDAINSIKPIFVEPKDKTSFATAMVDYYEKIQDPKFNGAIFMGVCRGKVSEGLDFADINGRAVLITGLPYPPVKDPKIILKRQYLDVKNSRNKEYLSGSEWYNLEATRAVNQAIGRVIRHKDDFGAIILLDSRFNGYTIKSNLSSWLQQHLSEEASYGAIIRHLRAFFQNAEKTLPPLKTREHIDLNNLPDMETVKPSDDYNVKIHKREKHKIYESLKRQKKSDD